MLTPVVFPQNTQYYQVEITSSGGCVFQDSVLVSVDQSIPSPIMQDTVILCQNDSLLLAPSNMDNANWFP